MSNAFQLLTLAIALTAATAAMGADYANTWSLPVGTEIPPINMTDQTGRTQTFESLSGEHGLLLFFNRSADW